MWCFFRELAVADRFAVMTACVLAVSALSTRAFADDPLAGYPKQPPRVIVTSLPGGSPDALARMVTTELTKPFKQAFIVENRPGNGGTIGANVAAKAAPDGLTLLLADAGSLLIAPFTTDLPYDMKRDLTPVSLLVTSDFVLAVPSSLGVRSVAQLVELAKAQPGKLNYGSTGIGSIHQLVMETFNADAGTSIVHIPYKGGSQAVVSLVAGEVSMMFTGIVNVLPFVKSGQVRLLAVAGSKRSKSYPDLPTLAELGYRDVVFKGDMGVFVPSGTPPSIVDKLSFELKKAVNQPEIAKRLEVLGVEPIGSTPQEASDHWDRERPRFAAAAKLARLQK